MVHSFRIPAYSFLSLVLIAACPGHLSAAVSAPDAVNSEPDSSDGLVRLDITVTDQSGSPVTGLKAEDFTLFDNGQPQKLVSFRAHDTAANKAHEPVEIILLLDALNLSTQQATIAEKEAEKFLREDQGRLRYPAMVYRLTEDGLSASTHPTTDGNALAEEIAGRSQPRTIRYPPPHADGLLLAGNYSFNRNFLSHHALGTIAIEARRRPGRKLLFWIGQGWPRLSEGQVSFDGIVEFSTRLREARIRM